MDPLRPLLQSHGRPSGTPQDCVEKQALLPPTRKALSEWATALCPLVLHCVLAVSIVAFMLSYVHANHFNIKERRPHVLLANGTTVLWPRSAPLQSDITTLISSALAIIRLTTAAWLGPLGWCCAFILMERAGLRPGQLHTLINYGIHLPRNFLGLKGKQRIDLLTAIILALVLPANIAAPVLTGSVTWVLDNYRMGPSPELTVSIPTLGENSLRQWEEWNDFPPRRERTSIYAGGFASLAWGRNSQSSPMKRVVLSSALLEINSTISNVTLLYFSVTKIEWVEDPEKNLTPDELAVGSIGCNKTTLNEPSECPLIRRTGIVAPIPDTPAWGNRSYPLSPSIVSETRLVVIYALKAVNDSCPSQSNYLPPNVGIHKGGNRCWAFAKVTYSAGVSICAPCRVSSYSTVQNDTELEIMGHPLTNESLFMMPAVMGVLALMNTSIPFLSTDPDEYVAALLSRSYSASWTALMDWMGSKDPPFQASYSAAIPSSQALVDSGRVYVWLCIQLLITISGALFLWVHVDAKTSGITDTTMAPFYLDSSNVYESGRDQPPRDALLKLQYEKHWKLKVE